MLAQKIPSKAYDCYRLLCDAVGMLYSTQLQVNGWSDQHINRLSKLLWAHAIRAEEFYGISICTENLEYSVHAPDDIRRHSSMDNYSCELNEQAIIRHKQQKHNAKGLEKTFAVRENIRHFLEDYQEKNGKLSNYRVNAREYQTVFQGVAPLMLRESSFDAAKALLNDMKQVKDPSAEVCHAMSYGVPIGSMKTKVFPPVVVANVTRFLGRNNIHLENIPNVLTAIKTIAIRDELGIVGRLTT